MLTETTLGEKLKDLRIANGYHATEDLANVINIPKTTLNDYENDKKNQDVGYANLVTLVKFYDVSMDWLLGLSDVNKHLNTAYSDLGLSDKAIDILKTKNINTRLLSEMMEHGHFVDFMADIEIYIDGLVGMRITALNAELQTARKLLKEQHNLSDNNNDMRTLLAGQIDETRYLRSIIYEDIDKILSGLRKNHMDNKKDRTVTSSDVDLPQMIEKAVNQYQKLEGSTLEKQLQLLSSFTGSNPQKMSDEEKKAIETLIKNMEKLWEKM